MDQVHFGRKKRNPTHTLPHRDILQKEARGGIHRVKEIGERECSSERGNIWMGRGTNA